MKLARIALAVIITLLVGLICPAVRADEGSAEVGLSATAALTISDVSDSSIGYYGATVSWKTNGDATSQVFYDTVSHDNVADYAYQTDESVELVSVHSMSLTSLSSSATYHYRVRSSIPGTAFIATSGDYAFTTLTPWVGGGGGGPPAPSPPITVSLTGVSATTALQVNRDGIVQTTCQVKTADDKLTLDISKDTKLVDSLGNALASLSAAPQPSLPAPPSGASVILAYDLGPAGATFSPPITLTIKYDRESLPEGTVEKDLYVAYWDGSKWIALKTMVNTETSTLSCEVSHFTTFAIIGAAKPAPVTPTPPAPTPPAPTPPAPTPPAPTPPATTPPVTTPTPTPTPTPVNWPLIGGIIAAVVAVVVAIFLFIRRRAD